MMRFDLIERRPSKLDWTKGKAQRSRTGLLTLQCDFSSMSEVDTLTRLYIDLLQIERQNQVACFERLSGAGVCKDLHAFMESRPEGSYRADFVDLWNLYHYVREARPQTVLEFGSGLSTVTMAYALAENDRGRLYSLEPDSRWARSTADCLPGRLSKRCEVVHSPGETCFIGERSTVRFREKPVASPDMIYIDGAPEGAFWRGAEDIFFMEQQLTTGAAIFIDGRSQALSLFREGHLARRWKTKTNMMLLQPSELDASTTILGLDQFANSFIRLTD